MTEQDARVEIRTLAKTGMDPVLETDEIDLCVAHWSATGDINAAIAKAWRIKQSACADRVDLTTGGDIGSLKRSQLFDHCGKMAELYEAKANQTSGVVSVQPTRGDRCVSSCRTVRSCR